jgi:hypothetical protein
MSILSKSTFAFGPELGATQGAAQASGSRRGIRDGHCGSALITNGSEAGNAGWSWALFFGLVHKYIDSNEVADENEVVEFKLPEAVAKALGKSPNDMYGEPTSGRRI